MPISFMVTFGWVIIGLTAGKHRQARMATPILYIYAYKHIIMHTHTYIYIYIYIYVLYMYPTAIHWDNDGVDLPANGTFTCNSRNSSEPTWRTHTGIQEDLTSQNWN